MKNKFSLILFSILLSTTFAWAQNPAYYELPEGAFAQGLAESSASSSATFFLPHKQGNDYTFISENAGKWTSGSGSTTEESIEYSFPSQMKMKFHTPQLVVGEDKYQYGSDGGEYKDDLYFRVGDSLRYYMTPATMYNDTGGQAHTYRVTYKSVERDTVGVFFNNTDVMYIDAIRIPITYGTGGTREEDKNDMFPEEGSHVVVNIYKATTTSAGKKNNQVDRSISLWKDTLKIGDFTENSTYSYRGTLNKTFTNNPITIDGPFVVELTEMKRTRCNFYVYCAKERPGCNKWGYYVDGTDRIYSDYTPAISVRAMFPALYPKAYTDTVIYIRAGGVSGDNRPKRTVFANYKWTKKGENGWNRTEPEGITMNYVSATQSVDSTVWMFAMGANTTQDVREGYVTFTFRGKELKFHVIQPPAIDHVEISQSKLSLFGSQTPTLTANVFPVGMPQKVTWVSEDETIATVDENGKVTAVGVGTTNIKAISADPDKYATCEVTVTLKVNALNVPTSNLIAPSAGGDVTFSKSGQTLTQIQYDIMGKEFVDNDWDVTFSAGCDWVEYEFLHNSSLSNRAYITLQAIANKTGNIREGKVKIEAYDYIFTYPITQEAPTLSPRDDEQEFVMSLQDDTVHNTNGDKVTKVYLESEVSLKDTINVTSEKGLTKIDTTFGRENDKYYVCLTFTRAKYVKDDTDDKITVSFKDNPDNNYEYTIRHKGAGELTTMPDYHTFVVGPKGGTALAVDADDKIKNVDSVRVSSIVPAENIQAEWYNDTHIGEFEFELKEDKQGSYRLLKSIKVEGENTTGANRLDSFRVFLPNCDTVKFYVRQEPTARVWQLYGDIYKEMEVNNKGGNAHFKDYTETVMTLFSNTQVTTGDIGITFTSETDKDWVHPSTEIKQPATRDSILITFDVDPWTGIEPRSTDMKITVLGTQFTIPLTQKAFGIKLSHEGNSDTLVVPIAGGMALWKGTIYQELHVDATEAYPDNLLKVKAPAGVEVNSYPSPSVDKTGLPRTTFTFKKTGTVTADWSDSIFISFDSTNIDEGFEYHFKDTFFITQALMPSAYYEVPAGAFFAGMTDNSGQAASEFYVPYLHNSSQQHMFSSGDKGKWTSGSGAKGPQETYSYNNKITRYNIPQLQVEGKVNYRYGASSTEYNDEQLYFYVGYPDMHYMTPARLWTDLVTNQTGYQEGYADGYKTTVSDKMGVYFNNIETMYIEGISIPISAGSTDAAKSKTKSDLFGDGSVTVTIYHAKIDGDNKSFERTLDNTVWTGTLTDEDVVFTPLSETEYYRSALNATFEAPISINGAFVIELSDMSGCNFYVLSDKSNGKNKWGYYIQKGEVSYPGNYCLAVSVRGMFPVLEKKDTKTALEFASAGGDDAVAFISNINPKSEEDFTVDFGGADWISVKNITYSEETYKLSSTDTITLAFTAAANTGEAREATITLKHHLKELTYTVSQDAAPTPKPTTYTRNVTNGNWGTICLPWESTALEGGDFYNVLGTKHAEYGVALTPIEAPNQLTAGKPYVFKATSEQITVTYDSETRKDAPVYADNHIYGSFAACDVPEGKYIIYNNLLYKAGTGVSIDENRAYFDVESMEAYNPQTAPARVIFFGGSQSPTGLEVQDARCTMHDGKYLINGQFVIIKDNKMYNAQGIEL